MLGIVIVSYRSDDLTVRFVEDQLSRITIPYQVVVVDNGATAEEAATLQRRIPDAVVLPAENRGFAAGNNIGIRYLLEQGHPDRILLTNNDIVFVSERVVEALVDVLDSNPEVGIVGPEVIGPDGCRQGPEPYQGMWTRFFWMYVATPFLSRKAKRRIFDLDYAEKATEGRHDKLVGAFMVVDTDSLVDAGLFDEGTFLYAEENILADRMSAIGKCCWFCPAVRVLHQQGQTIGKRFDTRRQNMLQFKSMAYYYRKYRGYGAFSVQVLSVLFRWILRIR